MNRVHVVGETKEMLNECTISLGAMHRGVEGTEDGLLHFMFLYIMPI